MLKKRFIVLAALIFIVFISGTLAVFGETLSEIGIMVNNRVITDKAMAVYYEGTIMAPARELTESLGGTFKFDEKTMTAVAKQGENELVFYLDESVAKYNGKYIQAPAPMKIINYRFMIPAGFVCEKLGAQSYKSSKRNMLMVFQPDNGKLVYQVMQGDTLWIISQLFGTSIASIRERNGLTGDMIYIGQKLIIKGFSVSESILPAYTTNGATVWVAPNFSSSVVGYLKAWTDISIKGKVGDWYKVETPKGNGYTYYTVTAVKQDISFNYQKSRYFNNKIPVDTSKDYIRYDTYTVQKGDYLWSVSEKFGITVPDLANANNISTNTVLYPGQLLKIPVHIIPEKTKAGPGYGEILDWFEEGQYVLPIGKEGLLTDLQTGKSFKIKRTIGASHSDTETLTSQDTKIMKEIFGGSWSWNKRPFILTIGSRSFAVSVAGMPHAGVDGVPFLQNVSNRSDNWGYGPNYDMISGNGMDGHFDMYFLNSLSHNNNSIDAGHQYNVLTAGGLR